MSKKESMRPFTEEERAAAQEGTSGEPELDEVDAAEIEERPPDLEPFENLVSRARHLTPDAVRNVLESLLFVSPEPLSVDQLFQSTGVDRELIRSALTAIEVRHAAGASGMVLHEVAGGYQFRTDPGSADYVRRFLKVKPQRLTRAAVETLAIIAYRQPVTRPEVEDIRGVDCGAVMKALLDRRLIKILGKKEEVGRPILYGTTEEFLRFFALKDLSALPTLREFQELSLEHQEIVEKESAPVPSVEGIVQELADPGLQQRLDEAHPEGEAALQELEAAIDVAEASTAAVSKVLDVAPAPPPTNGPAPQ
jgi:segregation and condensation protein B